MPNYIYALHCPIANTVRYIGKTNNPESRLMSHVSAAKRERKDHYTARWIRKLVREGFRPTMEILETLDDSEPWEEYERFYIEHGEYFGWRLTNTNPGGEGGGYIRPEEKEEWKLKVRAGFTAEVREHISKEVRAAINNPVTKAVQRENMRKRWEDPIYRQGMTEIARKIAADPAVRQRLRETTEAFYSDPANRKAISDKLSAFYSTPEGRANKIRTSAAPEKVKASREGQIKNWQDPAYREMIMALKTSPEVIKKQSDRSKELWADPAFRAKREEAAARRKAEKAALLAAATSAPYTESS